MVRSEPFRDQGEQLENILHRFIPWFGSLTPTQRDSAFRLTVALADASVRVESDGRRSLERYMHADHTPSVSRHERIYGTYREHVRDLEPPFSAEELGAVGWYLFVEPFHRPSDTRTP